LRKAQSFRMALLNSDDFTGLLEWLPDESLFSLISRQHFFWGYPFSWQTTKCMFGARRVGIHHDFPSGLDALARAVGGHWGTPSTLARQRTLLTYYRAFFSAKVVDEIALAMGSQAVKHVKFRLGLLTSRFRANHPLKACPTCLKEDLEIHGWMYWHLTHQYPGVWTCTRHDELLLETTVKSNGVGRFLWSLPKREELSDGWHIDAQDPGALVGLARMIESFVAQTCRRGEGWLASPSVNRTLRCAALERGWLTSHGSLRMQLVAPSYLTFCQALRGPAEFSALPTSLQEAASQIGRVLRPWRSVPHPLRTLLAINWLFESPDSFLVAYELLDLDHEDAVDTSTCPIQRSASDSRNAALILAMRSGASATSAARMVGVDVGTAMAWAAQVGLEVKPRAKSMKKDLREACVKALREGAEKQSVAHAHGVTVQAITRLLRTTPGLHLAWQEAVREKRRKEARTTWQEHRLSHGHLGIKWMRALVPATYVWLYRNDRAWLVSNSPDQMVRQGNNSRVRWDERDTELSALVLRVGHQLSSLKEGRRVKLWQVCQQLPELKPKLHSLERLPLTLAALELVLARKRSVSEPGLFSSVLPQKQHRNRSRSQP